MKNGPKSGKGSGKTKIKNKQTPPAEGLGIPGVDVPQLERLLDFMSAHGLEEFEYEHAGLHIRLRKSAGDAAPAQRPGAVPKPRSAAATAAAAATVAAEAHSAAPAPTAPAVPPAAPAPAPEEVLHLIKSPIVGTFYSAASPETPSFVKIGEEIQAGQVVCIIEAMKLMNEIESDIKGAVAKVLVENGQPVEYGQPLFAIRPAASSGAGNRDK